MSQAVSFVNKRTQVLFFLVLLAHMVCDAEGTTACCMRQPRSCRLYDLLCRATYRNNTEMAGKTGHFTNDVAAGILTLGKRKVTESRYQDRLQNLLQSSRNQAAGILTMGKRNEDPRARPPSHATTVGTVSAPGKLHLEHPLKYLLQPIHRDSYVR